MMHAYAESYVSGAQRRLGAMFEFAVYGRGLSLGEFYCAFLASSLAERFGVGEPAVVAGRSGEELALEVLEADAGAGAYSPVSWRPASEASPEYWAGWALAFYQWASGWSFASVQERVPIDQVLALYSPYHEMDVRQLCNRMDALMEQAQPQTNLKVRRLAAGLSQSQLAAAAGIPVRTLQQYEQRQKDVNRARADYVEALARVLCCQSGDLLERRASEAVEYAVVRLPAE